MNNNFEMTSCQGIANMRDVNPVVVKEIALLLGFYNEQYAPNECAKIEKEIDKRKRSITKHTIKVFNYLCTEKLINNPCVNLYTYLARVFNFDKNQKSKYLELNYDDFQELNSDDKIDFINQLMMRLNMDLYIIDTVTSRELANTTARFLK